jgi:hypothetical protein
MLKEVDCERVDAMLNSPFDMPISNPGIVRAIVAQERMKMIVGPGVPRMVALERIDVSGRDVEWTPYRSRLRNVIALPKARFR